MPTHLLPTSPFSPGYGLLSTLPPGTPLSATGFSGGDGFWYGFPMPSPGLPHGQLDCTGGFFGPDPTTSYFMEPTCETPKDIEVHFARFYVLLSFSLNGMFSSRLKIAAFRLWPRGKCFSRQLPGCSARSRRPSRPRPRPPGSRLPSPTVTGCHPACRTRPPPGCPSISRRRRLPYAKFPARSRAETFSNSTWPRRASRRTRRKKFRR